MKIDFSFRRIISAILSLSYCAAFIASPLAHAADPNAQTIEDAAASLSSGTVSDDFPTAMSGLVSDSSPDKCGDFGEAVSAGLQAAATNADSLSIQSTATDVVGMSQSVATSLLSLFTSYCAAPQPPGQNGPKIEITIKDCQEIRLQLDQCKRDLDNSKRDIGDFKNELARCQENVKNLIAKLGEKDASIAQLQKDIAAKDAEIQSLKDQLKTCKEDADYKKCKEAERAYIDLGIRISDGEKQKADQESRVKKLGLGRDTSAFWQAEAELARIVRLLEILKEQYNREAARINAHCGNNGAVPNIGNPRNGVRDDARGKNSNRGNTNKNRNTGTAKKKPSGNSRTKR